MLRFLNAPVHALTKTRSLPQKPAHKDRNLKWPKPPPFKVAPAYAPVSKRASSRSAYLYLECTQGKIGLR
jgi:hypothetical protein